MTTDTLHRTPQDDAPSHMLSTVRAFAHEVSARADEAERAGHHARGPGRPLPACRAVPRAAAPGAGRLRARAAGVRGADRGAEPGRRLGRWTATIGAGGSAFVAWLEPAVAWRPSLGPVADFTLATVFAPTVASCPSILAGTRCRDAGRSRAVADTPSGSSWAASCSTATPRGWSPTAGPTGAWRGSPARPARSSRTWVRDRVAGHGQQRRRRRRVPVPEELTTSPFFEPARHDGPLWRLPFFTLAGIALVGVPLGIARRALDELAALAPTKVRAGTSEPIAHDAAARRHGPGRGAAAGGSGCSCMTRSARCG